MAGGAPVSVVSGQVNAKGNVADNAADSGNPVKVGGVFNSSEQAYANGDRADLQVDSRGFLKTADVNQEVTVFASSARAEASSPFTSSDQANRYGRGLAIFLDITASSGTSPTLDVKLQDKDPVSGKYIDIPGASFAQKSGTGTDSLRVYPGIAETANRSVSDVVPKTWRAHAAVGSSSANGSFTFSLGASYVR